jgi:hypothetical protein
MLRSRGINIYMLKCYGRNCVITAVEIIASQQVDSLLAVD